ncbi:hypothetical protein QQS21_000446 [Conoideocrella luteorostrata]|uniref:Uncharacterized protein n=1 Tax=Conoideocrella luteorostrata TaxID=1105319 RepID=A0AAJ0CZ41_9HYPO|nr:hypothetical protein QQS21_000446 [Conoideocrella luteorostrata]
MAKMNITCLYIILLAVVVPLASANNCKPGLKYCGYFLLKIGNYGKQIDTALSEKGLDPTDQTKVLNTLFDCLGGPNGDIKAISFCDRGCAEGDPNMSDSCITGTGTQLTSSSLGSTSSPLPSTSSSMPSSSSTVTNVQATSYSAASAQSSTAAPTGSGNNSGNSTQNSGGDNSDNKSNSNVGAIAGGTIGGVAAVGLVGAAAFFLLRRKKKPQQDDVDHAPPKVPSSVSPMTMDHSSPPVLHSTVHEVPNSVRHELD